MDRSFDILHPFASLEWRECRRPPVDVSGATAVWLKDKVYVGGGGIRGSRRNQARLYIYTPTTDTYNTPIDTPVYSFALTMYRSQLLLVGGWEYVGENIVGGLTNKLWTLSEHGQWQETLPPLPAPRIITSAVSHGDHLLVFSNDYTNNQVYVYNGHHWASAESPSQRLYSIESTVFNGRWYLVGQEPYPSQKRRVYSASLDSLIASCQPSKTSQPSSLWKRLTDVPDNKCCPAVFGNRLVAVAATERGFISTTISLYAYSSSSTQSWLHRGDISITFSGLNPCAVVLPSNELMVVSGRTVIKVTLKMTHFNPESLFTLATLSLLEEAGIPVRSTLSHYTQRIQTILGLAMYPNFDLNALLTYWTSSVRQVPPTWGNLIRMIHLFNQGDVAQQMESYLRGGTEEPSPTRGAGGGEDVDEQLRLRDDKIFHLKQKMSTMRQRIEELNEELRSQHSPAIFKEEGDGDMEAKLRVQKETIFDLKQQMATMQQRIEDLKYENEELRSRSLPPIKEKVEEKPVAVLPVKTEIKEEAEIVTKAETTPAQPTTGMSPHSITAIVCGASYMSTATWNLRGVEVCGEMTVVVHFSHYQEITWEGFGLKLHIPEGSLPAGVEKCAIQIRSSLAGQYEFPENSHLVSAIFWLRCETVHKFAKPITVEIQHCAKSENVTNLKLSFVRAVCSQTQLPYTFKLLPGGNFTSHSSYGVIELNSFSGVGIAQEGSEDREYCSRIFYLPLTRNVPNQEVDLVISWNVEAHLTAVEDRYCRKGALPGPHQLVEFESETISLDIPMEGITIKGWKITPLMRPVVTKKQVDNFREGKLTPCCQLLAEVSGRRKKAPPLRYQITLKGAKYPNDIFTLKLPVEDSSTHERSQTFGDLVAGPPPNKRSRLEDDESANSATSGRVAESAIPKLKDLQKALYSKVADKWEDIGIQLDIEDGQLSRIKLDNAGDSQACLREMLRVWLSRVAPPPSWLAMADALDTLGHEDIATHLRDTYCQ